MIKKILVSLALTIPVPAFALQFSIEHAVYTDIQTQSFSTQLAVSTLSEANILTGNPDGTFKPNSTLNRAEFVTIAMRMANMPLLPAANCFPDVQNTDWFSTTVCTAKNLGYIRGNANADLPASKWLFNPEQPVRYVEALKILSEVYKVQTSTVNIASYFAPTGEWYEPYLAAAIRDNTQLKGILFSSFLTRAQMAELSVRFLAKNNDQLVELDALLAAKTLTPNSSSAGYLPGYYVPISSESSSSTVSSSSSSSSKTTVSVDPDEDVSQQSNVLLLGETSSVLGAASFFSQVQPLIVNKVLVEIATPTTSVSSFIVYTTAGELLGTATRSDAQRFELRLPNDEFIIPQAKNTGVYVRAIIKAADAGGVSGQVFQISKVGIETTGVWSDALQTQYTNETFLAFQTAAATFTAITNGGSATDILIAGTDVRLGSFAFAGKKTTSQAELYFTTVRIKMDTAGSVTVANVTLQDVLNKQRVPCIVTGNTIECSGITSAFGSIKSSPRTFALYGDVTLGGGGDASLQLRINEAGAPSVLGDVYWSDGYTNFTWVPGQTPLARATFFDR